MEAFGSRSRRVASVAAMLFACAVFLPGGVGAECEPYDDGSPRLPTDPLCTGMVQAPAVPAALVSGSLTTFFAANNGGSVGGGFYFDIANVGNRPIKIAYWDTNLDTAGIFSVDVFYQAGPLNVSSVTSIAGWTQLGNDPAVSGPGSDRPARVNVGGLVINPGEQYAIAFRCNNCAHDYTNGTSGTFPPGQVFNNGELELRTGVANNTAFISSPFNPRTWNGTVYYELIGAAGAPAASWLGLIALVTGMLVIGRVKLARVW